MLTDAAALAVLKEATMRRAAKVLPGRHQMTWLGHERPIGARRDDAKRSINDLLHICCLLPLMSEDALSPKSISFSPPFNLARRKSTPLPSLM